MTKSSSRKRHWSASASILRAESLENRRLLTNLSSGVIQLFSDSELTAPGLTGSYINSSLREHSSQDDWRETQAVVGQRIDEHVFFNNAADWGSRQDVGLTFGSEDDWQFFSVQWDGFVRVIDDGTRLQLGSDDSSRMWIDLTGDGQFASSGDEFIDNNWGTGQRLTYDGVSVPIDAGVYPVRIQFEEQIGENIMQLVGLVPADVADTSPLADYFTDETLVTPGLTGSYVDSNLRSVNNVNDWRQTQTIAGSRVDSQLSFRQDNWGTPSEVGLTGNDWDQFSVQWDGFVRINSNGTQLLSRSDDGSRFWLDANNNGVFEQTELVDNGWGNGQVSTYGPGSDPLDAGLYAVRIQYEDGVGNQQMEMHAVPDRSAVSQYIQFTVNAVIYPNHFTQPGGAASQADREQFRTDVEAGLQQYLEIIRIASRGQLVGTASVTFNERIISQSDYYEVDRGDQPPWLVLEQDVVNTLQAEDFATSDADYGIFMWNSESNFETANFYHGNNFISMVGSWPGVAAHEFLHLLDDNLHQTGQPGMVDADDLGDPAKYPHITTPDAYNAGVLDWASIPIVRNILALHENGDSLVDYRSLTGRFGTFQGDVPSTPLNPFVATSAELPLPGDVDANGQFDANDAFLMHLVNLGATNQQLSESKGASRRSANEIRSSSRVLQTAADVDGDGDYDANDSFLIQLVQLAASREQITASKGSSLLSAEQIRARVLALGADDSGGTESSSFQFSQPDSTLRQATTTNDSTPLADGNPPTDDLSANDGPSASNFIRGWLEKLGLRAGNSS